MIVGGFRFRFVDIRCRGFVRDDDEIARFDGFGMFRICEALFHLGDPVTKERGFVDEIEFLVVVVVVVLNLIEDLCFRLILNGIEVRLRQRAEYIAVFGVKTQEFGRDAVAHGIFLIRVIHGVILAKYGLCDGTFGKILLSAPEKFVCNVLIPGAPGGFDPAGIGFAVREARRAVHLEVGVEVRCEHGKAPRHGFRDGDGIKDVVIVDREVRIKPEVMLVKEPAVIDLCVGTGEVR